MASRLCSATPRWCIGFPTFQYCQGVEVGQSYEVHYVHSSAGVDADATDGVNADDLADGLGGMPRSFTMFVG